MSDYKDVEIKGRKWRILKVDAFTGSIIAFKILPIMTAFLGDSKLDIKLDTKVEDLNSNLGFGTILQGLTKLSVDDFRFIQKACLKVISENVGINFIPVLNPNDTFGAIGLENDTATVLSLTVHAFIFNIQSFLAGSPLDSLIPEMK
jgi:hypothetical protein